MIVIEGGQNRNFKMAATALSPSQIRWTWTRKNDETCITIVAEKMTRDGMKVIAETRAEIETTTQEGTVAGFTAMISTVALAAAVLGDRCQS